MPRSTVLVFALAALLTAGAFAFHVLTPDETSTPAGAAVGDGVDAAVRDLARRLDLLEREVFQPRLSPSDPVALLASLEERLHALEERPGALPSVSGNTRPPPSTRDEPLAKVDVRTLSDEDLVAQARTLAGRQARDRAAPYWRELIERGAEDALLVEANLELGYAHRGAKEHEKEEAAFREAMRIAGSDSEKGQVANYQIAWSERFRGDFASARDRMAEVASSRYTARNTTGHARLYVAHFSLELKDDTRAREALQSILRDFGDSEVPMDQWLADQATRMLERLK